MGYRIKNSEKKAMQTARGTILTMMNRAEIEDVARELAPDVYDNIIRIDSASERANLLVEIAHRDQWLDKLLALIVNNRRNGGDEIQNKA